MELTVRVNLVDNQYERETKLPLITACGPYPAVNL
jgi:hypothetical protein